MNKKGQAAVIQIFIILFLGAAWFAFVGQLFTSMGELAISQGATGIYLFFITKLNLWFWIAYSLYTIYYFSGVGGR